MVEIWEPVALIVSPQVVAEVLVDVGAWLGRKQDVVAEELVLADASFQHLGSNLAAAAKEGIPRQPVA